MSTSILNPVTLGMTGLEVSRVAFGTWQLGGEWGQFDEDEGIAAIRRARELGVNLFDTAQGYGFGASERLLGRALRDDFDNRREEVVVATKGGLRMTEEGLVRDASRAWLRSGVKDSLRRSTSTTSTSTRCIGPTRRSRLPRLPRRCRAGGGGQDSPRRRLELQCGSDRRARADAAGGDGAAALPSVPTGYRGRVAPLRA